MANYQRLVSDYLDKEGIRYSVVKDNHLKIVYNGDNLKSIPIHLIFDEDGEGLFEFFCWDIANFKDKNSAGIIVCNQLNYDYRWVKFYIDNDVDIVSKIDAMADEHTCGPVCLSMVRRMVNIVDDVYPTIMKALWT